MGLAEDRLEALGLELPAIGSKGKGIVPVKQIGNLLYTSGHGPEDQNTGEPLWTGKLGKDLTVEQGYDAARACGLILLSQLKRFLGDLEQIDSIVKIFGLVASADDFYEQPAVMHGCSDLMVEVFGERGRHARSAMGTFVLPKNIPVEIEMIVQVRAKR